MIGCFWCLRCLLSARVYLCVCLLVLIALCLLFVCVMFVFDLVIRSVAGGVCL